MYSFFNKAQPFLAPTGRVIMGAFFVLAGCQKLLGGIGGTATYIESIGLPLPLLLALIAIVIEIGAGGALLIGWNAKPAALILAGFVFIISFPFHGPQLWADNPIEQVMFMKNLVIFGALLFMAAYAGKDWSRSDVPPQQMPTL